MENGDFIPYSFALSQLYFWTYLTLTLVWGCKVKRVNESTLIETSTIITVVCFNLVLFMQAIYITLLFFHQID